MLDYSDYRKYKEWWKRQTPGSSGFQRSFIAETPLGDIIQADLNFHEKLVRLTLEVSRERGKTYISTIKNGSILKEKDLSSGRNIPLYNKFYPYRDLIACIPDPDFLEAISGVYDIYLPDFPQRESERYRESTKYDHIFGIRRESYWQKFLRQWREERIRNKIAKGPLGKRIKKRFFGEVHDLLLGAGISAAFYFHYFDYVILGLILGTMGVFTGGLDWWLRKRNPLLTKVLLFLTAGSYFFYNGYTRY